MGLMKSLGGGGGGGGGRYRGPFKITVNGSAGILAKLDRLETSGRVQVNTAGCLAAAEVVARELRRQVPADKKNIKQSIAWRPLSLNESSEGGAKVGAAVGKASRIPSSSRSGKKGVGIGSQNIHWWIAGAGLDMDRENYTTGRNTGKMEPQTDTVAEVTGRKKSALKAVYITAAKKEMQRVIGDLG